MTVALHNQASDTELRPTDFSRPTVGASVVITNFNYARFLRACVESALAQDVASLEVIVVDDGSTDGSLELLALLELEYPQLTVLLQKNSGQAAAINKGYAHARGEWVLFLDADDFLDSGALRTALESAAADTSILQFYLRTVDGAGKVIGIHPFCHVLESGNLFPQICCSGHFRFMPTSGNVFRRSSLRTMLPIPEREWRICADTYLVLSAASQGSVCTVPRILGSYRIHDRNSWYESAQSDAKTKQIIRNHLIVWSQLLDLRPNWPRSCDDYALLSLIRRVAISLYLFREQHALEPSAAAALYRKLRRLILSADVAYREKLLHLAILYSAKRGLTRPLRKLVAEKSGRLSKLLRASGRDDWFANTPRPSTVAELPAGRPIGFGQGGEGRKFEHYGFGHTENWRSWSSAERAGLVFQVSPGLRDATLCLDVAPYVCPPQVVAQRLEIRGNGKTLFLGTIAARATISFPLTPAINGDGVVALEFVMTDAVVPALVDPKSSVTRVTAVALTSVTLLVPAELEPERYPPLTIETVQHANDLLRQQPNEGWDCSGVHALLHRRVGRLRFSLPNPEMERFVIRLQFQRAPQAAFGDWRVTVNFADIASDTIDLRETGTAILIVPRGRAPKSGLVELAIRAFNILPYRGGEDERPGPRLETISLERYDLGPAKRSLWRAHQIVDFSAGGNGAKYLSKGWHKPDLLGTWSTDTSAVLDGFYFEDAGEAFLTLRLSAWSAGSLPLQYIRIIVNAVKLVEREIEQSEDVCVIVPARLIGDDRYLKIEIESRFVLSMHALDGSDATQSVGIRLEKLLVEPLASCRIADRCEDRVCRDTGE